MDNTIFYYVNDGRVISLEELSTIFKGFTIPHGSIGIVKNSPDIIIRNGYIENVDLIKSRSSLLPQDKIFDVFTDIVNRNSNRISKTELDEIVNSYDETYLKPNYQQIRHEKNKEYREKQLIKRKQNAKKILIALIIASVTAISGAGIKYINNVNKIKDDAYDDLKSNHCYINNGIDGRTWVAVNDHNELYGKINPDYKPIDENSKAALYNVLISCGYTNEEAENALSALIKGEHPDISYVFGYESKESERSR